MLLCTPMVVGPGLLLLLTTTILECLGQMSIQQGYKTRKLPGLDVCGKPKLKFEDKIINGRPAELGAYPWMANIGYTMNSNLSDNVSWNCAGSLITDQYILTAAHCVHHTTIRNRKPPLFVKKVRLGDLDLDPNVVDGANPMDFDVEKVTWHEGYSNARKENDIALIKLKNKVKFTGLMRPICLPPPQFQDNLFVGSFPTIAGWGKSTVNNAGQTTRLLEAEVEIQDTSECRRNVTSTSKLRNAIIDHRVVCAASPGKDSCQGDSGGPLMLLKDIRRNGGNYFLMGVVSYGFGCAEEGYPGVYTRVSEYMSWLIDNMDL
ncbi:venom protease-like isoform X2 [Macrosteles quadrilineatus]|uniref:venom protease-like isoform X2 n=1 Tax=Macrosteles quadrilineatus TaxID=74068 RepID=UPI0023E2E477|nr:venom protease-like isoform X2 [Macrosteles quadrilineatus]